MKKIFSTFLLAVSLSATYAQYDLTSFATNNSTGTYVENGDGDLYYSDNFTNTYPATHSVDLTSVTGPDTIFFPVNVEGQITPNSGELSDLDTLVIEIAVGYWGNTSTKPDVTTNNADFTISNKYNAYTYEDQSIELGTSEVYNEFKFVEGETDTVRIVVTDGLFTLNRIYIRSTNATVISNSGNEDYFAEKGIHIVNPVVNDQLTINLPTEIPSMNVSLMNLEGQELVAKQITAYDNTMDVADLKGVYILREHTQGTYKKIVIQ